MTSTPQRDAKPRRMVLLAGGGVVAALLVIAGMQLGSRQHHNSAPPPSPTQSTSPNSTAAGAGLLIEPAPASTEGGHAGPYGVRVGFDQSCKGAVEAATAYTEVGPIGSELFAGAPPGPVVAKTVLANNAGAGTRAVVDVPPTLTPALAKAFARDPWVASPSWGAFRVRTCAPAAAAEVDVWYCLFRTNPAHQADPTDAAGRECLNTNYSLVWQSGDWKLQNLTSAGNDATTDHFSNPDRTPLTTAQRATVVGIVPGWQEYADAPR
jgi:hypothetical protein